MMRISGPHLRGRLWTINVSPLVLLAMLLVPQMGAGADRMNFEHPVMMDSNGPGSELYVLDDAGVLHEFRVSENGLEEYGRVSIPPDFKAADMSFARSEMPGSMLMAGTEAGRGLVLRFSLEGRPLKTWAFQNVCSGVDSGEANHTAYVATSDSNEIYKLDLRGQGITRLARISDATKLGPVAFDESRQEIYVADVATGKIYQYSIAGKSSKVLVTGLSAPTALVFDAETRRLFIADPGRRAVFAVDTSASKPIAAPFASEPLRSPYGLTLISKGRVAVADYGGNSVFVFSGLGKLLFRFSSAQ